ncbi:MAG: HupE/UreJ family protein [Bacteroidota bacterium]
MPTSTPKPRSDLSVRTLLGALALLLVPQIAAAHNPDQSYLYLRVYDDRIEVRVEMEASDLDDVLDLTLSADDSLSVAEVQARLEAIRAFVEPHVAFTLDGERLPLRFTGVDVTNGNRLDFVLLQYVIDGLDGIPDAVDVQFDPFFDLLSDHVNLLIIEHNWKTSTFNNEAEHALSFSPLAREQTLDLSDSSLLNGFWGVVKQGVWHIWIGLDHILFLLALLLPAVLRREDKRWVPVAGFRPAFMNILAIVTMFTIAHSVTLTMAALDVVSLPSQLVESIIAASIAVAALHNLFPIVKVREWMIAFAFGLFHGFGFASVMGDIGMGQERLVLSVLGFNLGVELGQIAIIAVLFPVLYLIRTQRWYVPVVVRLGSVLLIGAAVVWLIERITGSTIGWLFYQLRQRFGF